MRSSLIMALCAESKLSFFLSSIKQQFSRDKVLHLHCLYAVYTEKLISAEALQDDNSDGGAGAIYDGNMKSEGGKSLVEKVSAKTYS